MAEAHSIATLSLDLKPRNKGVHLLKDDDGLHFSFHLTIPPWPVAKRSFVRYLHRTRNRITSAVYPLGFVSYISVVLAVVFAVLLADKDSSIRSGVIAHFIWDLMWFFPGFAYAPHLVKIIWSASFGGATLFFFIAMCQRYLLRALLHSHAWLYLEPGQKSKVVQVWASCVKFLIGKKPLLYSYSGSLPRLPVPALKDTCQKYVHAMEALQSHEELEETRKLCRNFLKHEGPTLQRYITLKSWYADNYISDWWEKYVYLHGRSTLMINSNYYVLDQAYIWPTKDPLARVANFVYEMVKFSVTIDRETLPPVLLSGLVPVCMSQASRMFSSTRIPGRECDELRHWDYTESKHVVVVCKNKFYKLFVFHRSAPYGPLTAWELEDELRRIARDAEQRAGEGQSAEAGLSALTALPRTRWAEVRETYFSEGTNFQSLHEIESSIMVVHLSDAAPASLAEQGRQLLADGDHIWFDKSITLVGFKNGRVGLNCEHSWGDAVMTGYMWEWAMTGEHHGAGYDEHGRNKRPHGAKEHVFAKGREPRRLTWELNPELKHAIQSAQVSAQEMRDDLDLVIICHDAYGKDFMKKVKVSPDAFVQMVLQIAFFRDYGKFQNTYEASMTRLFKDGRTETVRPVTVESVAFVTAFLQDGRDKEEVKKLLRKACQVHNKNSRDAMTGKGFDRHLFSLYIVSVGLKMESPFLKQALGQKWVLSTSQQPQVQTNRWDPAKNPEDAKRIGAGGGFGPVADDGYGVSYMLAGEQKVFFHISSKRSSKMTDSDRFGKNILQAFHDLKALFD